MVLTAIPTAIHGRLGVFAGVHYRTDSLRVRISGLRPTAADASPETYNQVLRTAGTGRDDSHAEEHIPSICLALRKVERSLLANLALHDIPDLPADEWSGHPDGRKPLEFPRPTGYDRLTRRPARP